MEGGTKSSKSRGGVRAPAKDEVGHDGPASYSGNGARPRGFPGAREDEFLSSEASSANVFDTGLALPPPSEFSPLGTEVCGCQGDVRCEFGAGYLVQSNCDPQSLDWPEHSVLFRLPSILRHRKTFLHLAGPSSEVGRKMRVCL